MRRSTVFVFLVAAIATMVFSSSIGVAKEKGKIVHDAEYYILKAQHGKKWAAEDKEIDKKLAEIRKKNGGKPPNLIYILLDDIFTARQTNRRTVNDKQSETKPSLWIEVLFKKSV